MIKVAGERIFPREVEEVLDAHPAVAESAALGLPDPMLGEKLVACVVVKLGASVSPGDLRAHCLGIAAARAHAARAPFRSGAAQDVLGEDRTRRACEGVHCRERLALLLEISERTPAKPGRG